MNEIYGINAVFENSLTSLWSTVPSKNYPSRLIALIHFRMQHWSYKFWTQNINILLSVFFFFQIWCLTAFVKVAYALFICQDIIQSKTTWSVEIDTFHESNFRGYSFHWFSVIRSRHLKICYHLVLICILTMLVVIAFLEVALWRFNKLRDHVTYKNIKNKL